MSPVVDFTRGQLFEASMKDGVIIDPIIIALAPLPSLRRLTHANVFRYIWKSYCFNLIASRSPPGQGGSVREAGAMIPNKQHKRQALKP